MTGQGPVAEVSVFPVSSAQRQLWLAHQVNAASALESVRLGLRLRGDLDVAALGGAIDHLVARHEVLRTVYRTQDGQPIQVVLPAVRIGLPVRRAETAPGPGAEALAAAFLDDSTAQPFDLASGPVLRTALLRLGPRDHLLAVAVHHIACDRWSLGILLEELAETYAVIRSGGVPPPLAAGLDYGDYATWEHDRLAGGQRQRSVEYWVAALQDAEPLTLPADAGAGHDGDGRAGTAAIDLGERASAAVHVLAAQHRVTPFVVLMTSFAVVLARYSGQRDIVVGTALAARDTAVSRMVGCFAKEVLIRSAVTDERCFADLLQHTSLALGEAISHGDVAFDEVWAALGRGGRGDTNPLTRAGLVLHNAPLGAPRLAGLQATVVVPGGTRSRLELDVQLHEAGGGFRGTVSFDARRFSAASVARLPQHLARILIAAADRPGRGLAELPLLAPDERALLLQRFATSAAGPRAGDQPLPPAHRQIEEQVRGTPAAVAIVDPADGRQVTYGQLNAQANRLARHLLQLGVGPDRPVGLHLRRSIDLITAMLAVLKAGSHYLALDPDYPADHLDFLLSDSGAQVVIGGPDPARMPAGTTMVRLPDARPDLSRLPGHDLDVVTHDHGLAYLLYTSGSSGRPKGVEATHRALATRTVSARGSREMTPADRVLQFNSINFDVSVEDIFPCLSSGATLVLRTADLIEPERFTSALDEHGITKANLTTAFWHHWLQHQSGAHDDPPRTLRIAFIGGEPAAREDLVRWAAWVGGRIRLVNAYGPTETTATATLAELTDGGDDRPEAPVPIGRPVERTVTYILDRRMEPVPVGVTGELFIGGAGVARGYHGQPGLTAERFVPHPFCTTPGARLYATGDLARFRPDRAIELAGRRDGQVKVRGFRVELGEVESALRAHPAVDGAVALVDQDPGGQGRLVCYYTTRAGQTPTTSELHQRLRGRLPSHMLPGAYVRVDSFPIAPGGKVDRSALPRPGHRRPDLVADYQPPASPAQVRVASVWSEVLQVDHPGIHDDFFQLGGNSLLATQVAGRLRTLFGEPASAQLVFDSPTIAEQARLLDDGPASAPGTALPAVTPRVGSGAAPLTATQQRMWFLQRLDPASSVFTVPLVVRLQGALDVARLTAALAETVRRHPALRTSYPESSLGLPVQRIHEASEPALPLTDLGDLDGARRDERLAEVLRRITGHAFDLTVGPALRCELIRMAADDHILAVTAHHIAVDAWSRDVMVGDIIDGYAGTPARGRPQTAVEPADVAVWQQTDAVQRVFAEQLRYWKDQLAAPLPVLRLPTDHPDPGLVTHRGGSVSSVLGATTTHLLRRFCQRQRVTPFVAGLATYAAFLTRLTGDDEVVIGVPVAGRTQPALEPVVACLLNSLALRISVADDPTFGQLASRVRQVTVAALDHQDVPFERVVDAVLPTRDRTAQPLFQVMYAAEEHDHPPQAGGLTVHPVDLEVRATQYDLVCLLTMSGDAVRVTFEYSAEVFAASTVEDFLASYLAMLDAHLTDPEAPAALASMLDDARRARALDDWQAPTAAHWDGPGVSALVEAQARRAPNALAVDDQRTRLTYAELMGRVRRLAGALRARGVGRDEFVAIVLPPSVDLVVGMLAVLRAGAGFLTLDLDLPRERLATMLGDAGVGCVVANQATAEAAATLTDAELVVIGPDGEPGGVHEADDGAAPNAALGAACLFYTSGSTSTPKGAIFTHQGLENFARSMVERFGLTAADRFLQVAPVGFDVLLEEVFPPLISGGCLLLGEPGLLRAGQLAEVIAARGVTAVELPPAYWHEWVHELHAAGRRPPAPLRMVALGGERVQPERLAQWLALGVDAVHVYGLTEASCTSTAQRWPGHPGAALPWRDLPIGRPLPNTRVYVIDGADHLVPPGVVGELCVGGLGLARGFARRPAETARRYVPDPFSPHPGTRMYRTGDLARYLPDGMVELLGRRDHQVKVNGYRIELGEIESALSDHPGVRQAAVHVDEPVAGRKRLVAYVGMGEAAASVDVGPLRRTLSARLPKYMVPGAIVVLGSLPTSPNGKIDRTRFPVPDRDLLETSQPYRAPATPVEQRVADLCSEVLAADRVGMQDDFFALGGNSLLTIRLVARIEDEFDVPFSLGDIFGASTIGEIALRVVERRASDVGSDELERLLADLEAAGAAAEGVTDAP